MPYIGKQPANVPVTADDIPNDSITSAKILDNVITISDIGPNAVGNSEMADDAIGLNELSATGTTNSSTFLRGDNSWAVPYAIQDGQLSQNNFTNDDHTKLNNIETAATADQTAAQIKTALENGIDSVHYVDRSVDAVHIAANTITANEVAANAIGTSEIIDDAVTAAKLANSINTDIATGVTGNTTANAALPKAGGTMTGHTLHGDNVKATYGASADLEIYSNGATSYILETGSGDLVIAATNFKLKGYQGGDVDETLLTADDNGAVTLYNNNSVKLATTSTGIDVTGSVTADGLLSGTSSTYEIGSSSNLWTNTWLKNGGRVYFGDTGTAIYGSSSLDVLTFTTTGSERLKITNTGNVGIGTSSPDALFTVDTDVGSSSTGTIARFHASKGESDSTFLQIAATRHGTASVQRVQLQAFDNDETTGRTLALNPSGGNVGIGTNSPATPLNVYSTVAHGGKILINSGTTTGNNTATLFMSSMNVNGHTGNVSIECNHPNNQQSDLVMRTGATDSTMVGTERLRINTTGIVDTLYKVKEHNGTRTHTERFYVIGNTAISFDITVPNEGGSGNSFLVNCCFNHYYVSSYGAHHSAWYSGRGTGVSQVLLLGNQTSSNAGSWSVSKPNSTTLRVTKSAGGSGGWGVGFVQVIWSATIG